MRIYWSNLINSKLPPRHPVRAIEDRDEVSMLSASQELAEPWWVPCHDAMMYVGFRFAGGLQPHRWKEPSQPLQARSSESLNLRSLMKTYETIAPTKLLRIWSVKIRRNMKSEVDEHLHQQRLLHEPQGFLSWASWTVGSGNSSWFGSWEFSAIGQGGTNHGTQQHCGDFLKKYTLKENLTRQKSWTSWCGQAFFAQFLSFDAILRHVPAWILSSDISDDDGCGCQTQAPKFAECHAQLGHFGGDDAESQRPEHFSSFETSFTCGGGTFTRRKG